MFKRGRLFFSKNLFFLLNLTLRQVLYTLSSNESDERMIMFSVGEFAKKTGLTVRTLHFYEERGLLSPARSRDNGRRFYGNTELTEVQKIVSLKQLGFSLAEIENLLRDPRVSLPRS